MNKNIDKEIYKVYEKHQDLIDSLPEEDKEAILGYIFCMLPKLMESTCVEPSIEEAYANYRQILDGMPEEEQKLIRSGSTLLLEFNNRVTNHDTFVESSVEDAYANYRKILDGMPEEEQKLIRSGSTRQDSKIKSMEKK